MIPKGTNVVVNFYVTDSNGVPLSTVSGITPHYRLNGGSSHSLVVAISSLGSDALGWFRFSTAQFNNSTGNLFITFSNDSGYVIMPWEDDIVPVGGATASDIWNYSFSGNNASSHLYNASANAGSAYIAIGGIDIPTPPTTDAIAASVWTYGDGSADVNRIVNNTIPTVESIQAGLATAANVQAVITRGNEAWTTATGFATADDITTKLTAYSAAKTTDIPTVPSAGAIATSVWGYTIGNPAVSASTYLGSIGTIPHDVWTYSTTGNPSSDRSLTYYPAFPTVASIQSGLATTANITSLWDSTKGSISALQTHGDTSWKTATGFATTGSITTIWNSTSASISALQTHGDMAWQTATGFATASHLSSVWNSTSTSISNLQTHGDQAWVGEGGGGLTASDVWTYTSRSLTTATLNTTNNPALATLDNITSLWGSASASISALQTHGDTSWKTATGFATPTDITTKLTAYSAAKNTDITALYNSISNSLDGGISAADVWDYAINGSSASVYLGYISTISTSTSNIITSIGTINTAIGSVNTVLGSVNTDIGTISNDIGSINTSLAAVTGTIGTVATAVNSNNAALLNWRLSTQSTLVLSVGDTTKSYSISRDLAGNITGVSPNN